MRKERGKLRWCTGLLIALLSLCLAVKVQGASFDCEKAGTEVEKLICADSELSKLDEEMGKTYAEALKEFSVPEALKLRQRQWFKRRDACVDRGLPKYIMQCVKEIYQQRLAEIKGLMKFDQPCPELPLIKREAEKAQCFKRWLGKHPMELRKEHLTENDRQFCTDFYQAIATASPEISYVEPVLRTEDPQHPGLASYRKCHEYEPIGLGGDYLGLDARAHGFRLYRLELDGNPENGLEEYLYEEESEGSVKNGTTQYVRVAFGEDQCDIEDDVGVAPHEVRGTLLIDRIRGLNSIILFLGRYYIIDLHERISLHSIVFDSKTQNFVFSQCNWHIPSHLLMEQQDK